MISKKVLVSFVSVFLVILFSMPVAAFWGRPKDGPKRPPQGPDRQKIMQHMEKKLNLTEEQKEKFKAGGEQLKKNTQATHEKIKKLFDRIKDEMQKENPDRAFVLQAVKQIGNYQTEINVKRMASMLDFYQELEPEQQKEFRKMAEERPRKTW